MPLDVRSEVELRAEEPLHLQPATPVDLLLAAAARIERRIFPRQDSPSIFDMPLKIRAVIESYDHRPELAHVVAETTMRGISGATPSPRRAMLEEMIDAEVPSLANADGDDIGSGGDRDGSLLRSSLR